MDEIEKIKGFISEKCQDVWDKNQRPLMLSDITPELKLRGINYKEIIFPLSLKKFIANEMEGAVKIVTHPYQRAKVGVIPAKEQFEFAPASLENSDLFSFTEDTFEATSSNAPPSHRPEYGSGRYIVNKFLDELAKLPKEDIEKVEIPVSILIKMIAGR